MDNNNETLTVTKQRVLEAAKKCEVAKETLEALFPDAFKKEPFKLGDILSNDHNNFFVVSKQSRYYLYFLGNEVYDPGQVLLGENETFSSLEDLSKRYKYMKVIFSVKELKSYLSFK